MASITIRNLPDSVVQSLNHMASVLGTSREAMLTELINDFVGDDRSQVVICWIKADCWGDIDERDEPDDAYATCTCGQGIMPNDAWMAVMGSGLTVGPYCGGCGNSD